MRNNQVAQAYLFCGPRGVGKTTCARILAKTINCQQRTADLEACGTCDSCVSFQDGQSLNIFELDAASHNSVDDIRSLIDQVRLAPALGTHKVYIIDEVHMLSTSAFNAFLKTLEEPPRHAIFILATTEKHKILPTILSRCQIFDFNRIGIIDIANHLMKISEKEGIQAEPDALHIIAQKADGALRDALSIFDQIVSFAGKQLTYKAVIDNLNILDYDYYFKATAAIQTGDIKQSLLLIDQVIKNGFDPMLFVGGLAEHYRNLLVCRDPETLSLLEAGDNIKSRYREQASSTDPAAIVRILELLSGCELHYKASKNPRLLVEITLMQACSLRKEEAKKKWSKPFIAPPVGVNQPVFKSVRKTSVVAVTTEEGAVSLISLKQTVKVEHERLKGPISKEEREKNQALLLQTIMPSIKPIKGTKGAQGVNESGELVEETKTLDNVYTADEFFKCWHDYALTLKDQGKESVYATLTGRNPDVDYATHKITVFIDNKVQEQDLIREKQNMAEYLREHLQNSHITIHWEMSTDPTNKNFYTPREKFMKMAEKNPALFHLQKRLKLDLDF